MNKQISVLLPGSFFEEDYHRKVSYLSKNKITRVYLFDHSLNPADDHKAVYEAKKALSLLLEDQDSNFDLGLCVLNINSRKISESWVLQFSFMNILDYKQTDAAHGF